jgi:hypothetical protein
MPTLWHGLTELEEVYARHAARHGPNRLLPAAVLPAHGRVPEHRGPSPQGSGPDEGTEEPSTPMACTRTRIDAMKEHAVAHEAGHGSDHNGHGAVDRDRLREEISHLETSLRYWQARWQHTPGPSDPGTPRHRIEQTIDLLRQELGLKRGLASTGDAPPPC